MMSENNSDFGAFLAGFVIGGLVGAATALILAPQSGQETRAQIASRSEDLRHMGEERFQQARETAVSYAGDYTEKVQEATSQAQERARIVLDSGKEQAAKLREQVAARTPLDGEEAAEEITPTESTDDTALDKEDKDDTENA